MKYNALMLTLQLEGVEDVVRRAVAEALAEAASHTANGFLDVAAAAEFIASTPAAIRSLVKRSEIPFYKAPNGRLLFDRDELAQWVRDG